MKNFVVVIAAAVSLSFLEFGQWVVKELAFDSFKCTAQGINFLWAFRLTRNLNFFSDDLIKVGLKLADCWG